MRPFRYGLWMSRHCFVFIHLEGSRTDSGTCFGLTYSFTFCTLKWFLVLNIISASCPSLFPIFYVSTFLNEVITIMSELEIISLSTNNVIITTEGWAQLKEMKCLHEQGTDRNSNRKVIIFANHCLDGSTSWVDFTSHTFEWHATIYTPSD